MSTSGNRLSLSQQQASDLIKAMLGGNVNLFGNKNLFIWRIGGSGTNSYSVCKTYVCGNIPKVYASVYILGPELNYILVPGLRLLISNTGEGAVQDTFMVFYSLNFLKTKYSPNGIFISCVKQKRGHTPKCAFLMHTPWSPSITGKHASHWRGRTSAVLLVCKSVGHFWPCIACCPLEFHCHLLYKQANFSIRYQNYGPLYC